MPAVTGDTKITVGVRLPIKWVARLERDGEPSEVVRGLVAKHLGLAVPRMRARNKRVYTSEEKTAIREQRRAEANVALELERAALAAIAAKTS